MANIFKKIGGAIKHGVQGLGHLAEKAAPIVGLIPGVGTIAGGAIGGLGALAAGDGLSGALKYGLEGAASGFGGGLLKGAGGATSLSSILGGGGAAGGAIPDAAMGISGGGGGISGLLGSAGKFLIGNGGKNALGLAQGVDSILNQQKANQYGKDALGAATGAYNAAAPLRAQGLEGLLHPQAPDLSGLSQIAGTLTQAHIPQGTPRDTSSLNALQSQLAQLKGPQAGALSQFTAPQKPSAASVQSLMHDPGNPYARAS